MQQLPQEQDENNESKANIRSKDNAEKSRKRIEMLSVKQRSIYSKKSSCIIDNWRADIIFNVLTIVLNHPQVIDPVPVEMSKEIEAREKRERNNDNPQKKGAKRKGNRVYRALIH
ncbi:MAG: hypothetical protein ACAI35_04755 [Candidatus Methylacidiphilales bacterium]|nr:hypothetical protein [Candidatus Methylacidiphilales bacterium]